MSKKDTLASRLSRIINENFDPYDEEVETEEDAGEDAYLNDNDVEEEDINAGGDEDEEYEGADGESEDEELYEMDALADEDFGDLSSNEAEDEYDDDNTSDMDYEDSGDDEEVGDEDCHPSSDEDPEYQEFLQWKASRSQKRMNDEEGMGESNTVSTRLSRMFGALNEDNKNLQSGKKNPTAKDVFSADTLGDPDVIDVDNEEPEDKGAANQDYDQQKKLKYYEEFMQGAGLGEARLRRRLPTMKKAHYVRKDGKLVRVKGGQVKRRMTLAQRMKLSRRMKRSRPSIRALRKAGRSSISKRKRKMTLLRNQRLGTTRMGYKAAR